MSTAVPDSPTVIFDGECNVCNGAVQFIIKRDPTAKFEFAASQSDAGRALLARHGLVEIGKSSVVLLKDDRIFLESDAVLEIAAKLEGPCRWLRVFKVVPRFLRNPLYRLFARLRYRLFGKKTTCMVPTPDVRRRFL